MQPETSATWRKSNFNDVFVPRADFFPGIQIGKILAEFVAIRLESSQRVLDPTRSRFIYSDLTGEEASYRCTMEKKAPFKQ